jgi:hypothetical protein
MNEKGNEMNSLAVVRPGERAYSNEEEARPLRRRGTAKIQTVVAAIGLLGGPAAAFFGAILTAAGRIAGNGGAGRWLSVAGSVLLFLTVPLIILGACCLDSVEKGNAGRSDEDVSWTYIAFDVFDSRLSALSGDAFPHPWARRCAMPSGWSGWGIDHKDRKRRSKDRRRGRVSKYGWHYLCCSDDGFLSAVDRLYTLV